MKCNLFLKTQVIPHSWHSPLVVKADQLMFCWAESLFVLIYSVIKKDGLNFVSLSIRNWVHLFE